MKKSKRKVVRRGTVGFYQDEVAIIDRYDHGKGFSDAIRSAVLEMDACILKLRKRIEKNDVQINNLKEQLKLEPQKKEIKTTIEGSAPLQPRLSPMEREKRYQPCHNNLRMYDENLDIFFCGKKIKPPYTERKITNAKVTPERCKLCIDIHQRVERLTASMREKKSDQYSGKPKIDWGKSEAYPNDGWL